MRCKQVQQLSTEYLDGHLSDELSSAIRGHLRQCDECCQLVAREAEVRAAAESLPELDPPPALWHRIQDELAEREVADSQSPLAILWLRQRALAAWPHVLGAAALALVAFWLTRSEYKPMASAMLAPEPVRVAEAPPPAPSQPIALPTRSMDEARTAEMERAEARYQSVVDELLAAVEERRAELTPAEERELDKRMAAFRAELARRRRAGGTLALNPDLESQRAVYAVYRRHIDYLSDIAVGGTL